MHLVRRLSSIELQRPGYFYRGRKEAEEEEDETTQSSGSNSKSNKSRRVSSWTGRKKSREKEDIPGPSIAQHVSSHFVKLGGNMMFMFVTFRIRVEEGIRKT